MALRSYSGNAAATTITAGIGTGDTSITIASATGWPTTSGGSFFATIDRNLPTEEKILVTARSGTSLTVTRGQDDTSAAAHSSGAAIEHTLSSTDLEEANAHVNTSTGVHGATGAVLGVTDHDVEARHTFGAALGTPVAPSNVSTAASAGSGNNPAREDHVHDIDDGAVDTTAKLANDIVTYAKIQNVTATDRILGRDTAGAGDVEELEAPAVKTMLSLTKTDVGLGNVDNAQQQPIDADLTAIAGLTASDDDVLQRKAGAWANRTLVQLKTDLAYPLFWEELDRDTLASAGDTLAVSFTAKRYLMVIIHVVAGSGTTNLRWRFNADSGNNYARRSSVNGGADTTGVSGSGLDIGATTAVTYMMTALIDNFATAEKLLELRWSTGGTTGAAAAPARAEYVGKWANATDQINAIDITNTDTGEFGIGTEVVVLGHN